MRWRFLSATFVMIFIAGLLVLMLALLDAALAHEDGADPNAAWYRGLKVGDMDCCDMQDCHPTEAWNPDTRDPDFPYTVKIGDDWIRVEKDKVLKTSNPTGMAVECHHSQMGFDTPWVRCFIPPSLA